MFDEQAYLPFTAGKLPSGAWLVIAPHPDDEAFGMGGILLLAAQQGIAADVLFLTSGDKGGAEGIAAVREQEALEAARLMGIRDVLFWRLPDRSLSAYQSVIARLTEVIGSTKPGTIFFPSPVEPHPDHRAASVIAWEALRRAGFTAEPWSYEISVQGPANHLLDISQVVARKREIMAVYASQMTQNSYVDRIMGLNQGRAWSLPLEVTHAEAFFIWPKQDRPLNAMLMEFQTPKLGMDAVPDIAATVSVIIRTKNRPNLLREAIVSVATQTYRDIELVVVNDGGEDVEELVREYATSSIRRAVYEALQPGRGRSVAANTGLDLATGKYLIFLDDDDIFYPDHIASLAEALRGSGNARCAYAGVRVEYYNQGQLERTVAFNEPFDLAKLWGRNFIPIHAVLFERSLHQLGCRFDETFEILEDWDFWLQLSQRTQFVHLDKISACYRNFGESGLGNHINEDLLQRATGSVFEKWKTIWTGRQWADIILYRDAMLGQSGQLIVSLQTMLAEREAGMELVRNQLTDRGAELELARNQLSLRDVELEHKGYLLTELETARCRLREEKDSVTAWATSLQQTVDALRTSTSWRTTAPLRFVSRLIRGQYWGAWDQFRHWLRLIGRSVYRWLPARWGSPLVSTIYRLAGPLFIGFDGYELWMRERQGWPNTPPPPAITGGVLAAGMVDIASVLPLANDHPGRIAIHAHVFYPDLAPELAYHLTQVPFLFDLFVSVASDAAIVSCKQAFGKLPQLGHLTVTIVPNRGRDIAPMLCAFGAELMNYEFIAHIHSKKSLYNNGATDGWREYLLANLLGSDEQVRRIFSLLTGAEHVGFVYPQNFWRLPYMANTWLANQFMGRAWCQKLGIRYCPTGYFSFPAGSMFWARTEALRPLFDADLKLTDFLEETGQTDGTLAHCLERMLPLVTNHTGFKSAILLDTANPSWSPWRFDQYFGRTREHLKAAIDSSEVRVVIFDIFDTLITRPLLNPESTKAIVARRVGGDVGHIYLDLRAKAEANARLRAGRDVALDAIFEEFAVLSGLPSENVAQLRDLEETVECNAATPRPETIALLRYALEKGKRIILASDMYLARPTVESMLRQNGIDDWHALYLSSDTGFRKDTGETYRHILTQEDVRQNEVLVIGDNERSDFQIPCNMGINKCGHVLRPVELAKALPRLAPLVERTLLENDLDAELTLGIIVQGNFHPVFFPRFDPTALVAPSPWAIGYSVLGPLALAFVQWLAAKAAADGIERLYFLSREGQFLKTIYDLWTSKFPVGIPSDYLVLSRRTMTVSTITTLENIYTIARKHYFPNPITSFLHERYGLELNAKEIQEFWPENRPITVKYDENIDELKPLLLALEEKILAQSQNEQPGLLAYLNHMGLNNDIRCAVVDIGYSATIQDRLNRLLNRKIHGYYLATDKRAEAVSSRYEVITQGCFAHYVTPGPDAPSVYRDSFQLERLLSSDEGQIVRYQLGGSGEIWSDVRPLSDEEQQAKAPRAEIQSGAVEFVQSAIAARSNLLNDFLIPAALANDLYEAFVKNPATTENDILRKLVLDDYYCGRGLV